MNLTELKKQIKNQDSNYYFKRDVLVKSYALTILNLYNYVEVMKQYKTLNNDKLVTVLPEKILFNSDHVDLAHAKHEALAILDYFNNKIKKDFSISTLIGVKNGVISMFITNSSLYQVLISIKFVKNKLKVELKGQINLSSKIKSILEETSFDNLFKPYLIALYPIQLNEKKVLAYGTRIAKKISQRSIHDIAEIEHSEKAKLTSQLKIPFSISYGVKDLVGQTLNVYHHPSQKYSRVKLNEVEEILQEKNQLKIVKDSSKVIYSCKAKECLRLLAKLEGNLISPFNQIIHSETCFICSKEAKEKFINIKVGERI